eukprot:g10935.t1
MLHVLVHIIKSCDPNGCSADLSRDRDTSDGSRWRCNEDLIDEQCTITYEFDEPQDIIHLNIASYTGDERLRKLAVTASDGFYQEIESNGTTDGYERFVVNTYETAWMTMDSMGLDSDEWISIKRGAATTLRPGDYALVSIHDTSGVTLRGSAVALTTIGEYSSAFGLGVEGAQGRRRGGDGGYSGAAGDRGGGVEGSDRGCRCAGVGGRARLRLTVSGGWGWSA